MPGEMRAVMISGYSGMTECRERLVKSPARTLRPTKPSAILARALRLLERDGWCQGDYTRRGKFCSEGAIYKAAGGLVRGRFVEGVSVTRELCYLARGADDWNTLDWNDAPERRFSHVRAAFRRAIALAKEAGE